MFLPIGDEESRPGSHAVVVMALIAVNITIFIAEMQVLVDGGPHALEEMVRTYGATPTHLLRHPQDYWPTAFSHMFMHASWMHLLGNMLFMWIFADNIEDLLGSFAFINFYLLCGLAALAAQALADPASTVPMLGASGAISGVLGAYIWTFPRNRVRNLYWLVIFVGVIKLPAWFYLGVWFLMQVSLAADPSRAGGVAVVAHAGGFVAGMLLINVFPKRQIAIDYYNWKTASR